MTDFYKLDLDRQIEKLQQLARAALENWDIGKDARLNLIKYRENAVFSVEDGAAHYALRVHRPNYHSDAELRSELQWISAINSPALRTPQIIPTRSGGFIALQAIDGVPEQRQVDLLEWVEGEPVATIEEGMNDTRLVQETFNTIGKLMAYSHNFGEHWQMPENFCRHAWDIDGLLGEKPFWGEFWENKNLDTEQRDRLFRVQKKARADLKEFGQEPDRYGLIHADFLPENLLRSEEGICLIDFDDAGFGWHLFDVATSLFFFTDEAYFDEARSALIAGYGSKRNLPEEHMAKLPLFFLLRGITYLGWMHTRPEVPMPEEMITTLVAGVDEMAREYLGE
jgi:Ser/Thr protein kinase RdoA (MazF antagonist)